ncbi:hypothetical protein P171DRAFT_431375 [Karstenula rhodostoma CBS 690.94]|uniref:Uncharacterized protein n=1 Tax=Karstenula rhodostoma CBS 690.94 TaxID=1392251 RepID=A0A9P4UEA1_9PLEO|nr:hypothetical protein P171DRAFT_431375 [Karstenula rhodostoma CBS 690.94]
MLAFVYSSNKRRMSRSGALLLYTLLAAIGTPGATARIFDPHILGNKRRIAGVVSSSAGVAFVPLQAEDNAETLRWMVRALWVSAYGVFLFLIFRRVKKRIRNDGPIYLFCALLLTAHFVSGFVKTAETTKEAANGLFMFGPLAATTCAKIMYIPFLYRPTDAATDSERSLAPRPGHSHPASSTGRIDDEDRAATGLGEVAGINNDNTLRNNVGPHDGENGDIALVQRLMKAVVG